MRHQGLWQVTGKSVVLGILCSWGMQAAAFQTEAGEVGAAPRAEAVVLKEQVIGNLRFKPCTLKGQEMPGMPPAELAALCSTLSVPENADQPKGRQISLQLSWVPPSAQPAASDPVVLLAGGPGQSARESWPPMSAMLGAAVAHHPVLLIDQRGTGASNRLDCASPDGTSLIDLTLPQTEALIASCPRQLADKADVRHYGTPDVVRDLERVRAAMGLETMNLLAVSYGTRTAQHYAQAYPKRVRSMVLDSPLPNDRTLTEGVRRVYGVLDEVFASCQQHPVCAAQAGDSRTQLIAALAALRDKPVSVQVPDPVSGRMITRKLTESALAGTVRMLAYSPETAALLPEMIAHLGQKHYEMATLLSMRVGQVITRMVPLGTYYATTCAEDLGRGPLPPAVMQDWLRIHELLRVSQAGCEQWPSRSLARDFHEPLVSSIPTLIVSGGQDPIIPPSFGDEIAAKLSKARHLLLPHQGHNAIVAGCMPQLLAQFLKQSDPKALDAACLAQQ